jgi:hypothetical protein
VGGNRAEGGLVQFLEEPDFISEQNYLNVSLEHNTQNHQIQFSSDYSQFKAKQHIACITSQVLYARVATNVCHIIVFIRVAF